MVYSYKTNKLILEHLEDTGNYTEKKEKKVLQSYDSEIAITNLVCSTPQDVFYIIK